MYKAVVHKPKAADIKFDKAGRVKRVSELIAEKTPLDKVIIANVVTRIFVHRTSLGRNLSGDSFVVDKFSVCTEMSVRLI